MFQYWELKRWLTVCTLWLVSSNRQVGVYSYIETEKKFSLAEWSIKWNIGHILVVRPGTEFVVWLLKTGEEVVWFGVRGSARLLKARAGQHLALPHYISFTPIPLDRLHSRILLDQWSPTSIHTRRVFHPFHHFFHLVRLLFHLFPWSGFYSSIHPGIKKRSTFFQIFRTSIPPINTLKAFLQPYNLNFSWKKKRNHIALSTIGFLQEKFLSYSLVCHVFIHHF